MENSLKMVHRGYYISGESVINLWGGGQGTIEMCPTYLKKEDLSKTKLLECINDGQFGCESIDSALLNVYDVYLEEGIEINNASDLAYGGHKKYNRCIEVDKIK